MATDKEETLQIKKFRGVDRFVQGTAKEPDYFYLLQNMNQPNPGELKSLGGVTKLNGAAISGVEEFKHARFLDLGAAEKSLIAFYESNVSSIPAPSGQTFATSGGSSANRNVYLMYVGPGNSYSKSVPASQAIEANGLTVTLPTNVPTYVFCVHVFIADTSGNYLWSGSFTRRDNAFPASILCPRPTGPVATLLVSDWTPAKFSVTFGTGGNLTPKRQYYFGLAPWISPVKNGVSYKTNNGSVMSCYLPEGKTSIALTFEYCPAAIVDDIAAPFTTEVAIAFGCVFVGTTLEDGLICGNNVTNGTILPTAVSVEQSLTITSVSAGNDTVTLTGNVPELARLKYVAGTPDGGLTNNGYYYARNVVYNSATNVSTFQLSADPDGTVANLDAAGVTQTLRYRNLSVTIKEIPESSDLWSLADSIDSSGALNGFSIPSRSQGIAYLTVASTPSSADPTGLGCMAITTLPFTPSSRREILTNHNQKSFTAQDHTPDSSTLSAFVPSTTDPIQSRQYAGRMWCVNGFNTPFYTNGYAVKPAVVDGPVDEDEFPNWFPITDFLEFFKDQLCLAGMSGNATYTEGFVYPSATGNPNDWGLVGATPTAQPVRGSDPSEILGLNIYSQDLSNLGPQTFLVTGKRNSVFTWDGDPSNVPQQIDKAVGFAGPNCYALTKFGPVYVGRDNVYLFRTSQDVVPIGDSFKDIIQNLSNEKLFSIQAVYVDEEVKIGIPTGETSDLDSEIWLRMWYDRGGIQKTWTGPHVMKEYTLCAIVDEFEGERNYRASISGADLFRRDDPGSFLNDGQLIQRNVTILNLGMTSDHLLKLITQLYMGLRIVQDEEFTITLQAQDGSQSLVFSTGIEASGNLRQMLQCRFDQRFLARVLQLSVQNESDADLSIYDFSILFQPMRRRRIP